MDNINKSRPPPHLEARAKEYYTMRLECHIYITNEYNCCVFNTLILCNQYTLSTFQQILVSFQNTLLFRQKIPNMKLTQYSTEKKYQTSQKCKQKKNFG